MDIYSMQTFPGRNIYCSRPVVKMVVDIGGLHAIPTSRIEGFNEKLLESFPGLGRHYCSLGYEGGFKERLIEGTYAAHVLEHLILEMQSMTGYDVRYGKTRVISEPSLYYTVFEYKNERCAVECARAAVSIISAFAEGKSADTDKIMEEIRKTAAETELGPSAKAIFDEASRRGIPVVRLGGESLMQLGYGKYSRLVEASLTDGPSCIAVDIAGNKHLTKQLLAGYDIPVPYGEVVQSEEAAVRSACGIGYPVVVKPCDSNQGKGVSLNLVNDSQVREAYSRAAKYSRNIIVEKYITGRDYRVLVVGGRVSAVAERKPPCVTGDGIHTIKELVELENGNPLRGDDHDRPLTKIVLDDAVMGVLAGRGMDLSYIVPAGEKIYLRDNANLSTGGTARDCTEELHPLNAELAVKAVKAVGLDIAGVDITAEDIALPLRWGRGAVIEVNAAPGLRMHLYPSEGRPRKVAADIIDMLYPDNMPSRVPIAAITGTNGKTTTTRLVRHTLAIAGKKVGMTSTSGVFIGDECVHKGDNTGPASARLVLSNREVEVAVLETARGGIVRRGLGYDMADVGVVVNISEDHLGLDNVETLEDLAFVKSVVLESVKPGGYSVINADDRMADYLMKRTASRILLFSQQKDNILIAGHVKKGGTAVCIEDRMICIYDRGERIPLIKVEEIPITMEGVLECNIENALAAASALYALGTGPDAIRLGLKTFKPDVAQNPGRFNIFDMGEFTVILDYGHNPAGYRAMGDFIKRMGCKRPVGVIGMPGDRLDRSISEVGEICSRIFSRIYIKEDEDLRGRKPGEVAEILYDAVLKSGVKKESAVIIPDELKALETAILDAQPGDVVVMFYEKFEQAVDLINKYRKELEQGGMKTVRAVGEAAV